MKTIIKRLLISILFLALLVIIANKIHKENTYVITYDSYQHNYITNEYVIDNTDKKFTINEKSEKNAIRKTKSILYLNELSLSDSINIKNIEKLYK